MEETIKETIMSKGNQPDIESEADVTSGIDRPEMESACTDAPQSEEPPAVQAGYFRIFGLSSLLYAMIYTVCMFHNSSGITMPVWIAATILYACLVMKQMSAETAIRQSATEQSAAGTGSVGSQSAAGMGSVGSQSAAGTGSVGSQSAAGTGSVGSQSAAGTGSMGRLANGRFRAESWIYIAVMLLLGIATCLTDNRTMIVFNYAGYFMILILFLLHNFYDDSQWDFTKSLTEVTVAVFGAIGCMFDPLTDGYAFCQEKHVRKNKTLRAVMIGLVLAAPCILFLGFCLMCADAVFDTMVMQLVSGFRFPMKVLEVSFMLLFGYFSSYCGMRYLSRRSRAAAGTSQVNFDPVIAMTFAGLLSVMYLVFCSVQIVYLFAGNMQLPKGLTYAEYAHRGFYMLLFVCLVNLLLVLFIRKYFAKHKILDGMLLLICACTFIMIASSAYRMFLYIAAYQLTFLRVTVLAALAALTFLMAGVMVIILNPRFPLFRYSMAVVTVIYLCLAFSHVDNMIASYNLSHAEENAENMDWWYLSQLSLDAAPAVADYYANASRDVQKQMELVALRAERADDGNMETGSMLYDGDDFSAGADWFGIYMYKIIQARKNMGLRNFNVSRYKAVKLFKDF